MTFPFSKWLKRCFLGIAILTSCFCQVYPDVNKFALVMTSLPSSVATVIDYRMRKKQGCSGLLTELFASFSLCWFVAFLCWTIDQAACDVTLRLGFPYFHALWHIYSALGICNLANYFIMKQIEDKQASSAELVRVPSCIKYSCYSYLKIHPSAYHLK